MAKHGGNRTLKRLVVSSKVSIPRKEKVWVAKPRAGPHQLSSCMALSTFLTDVLKLTGISRESKKIIKEGKVLVDGRVIKDYKFPIGFMDLVSIPSIGMTFVVDYDSKGRLTARRNDNLSSKLAKVVGKGTIKNGRLQIHLSNGYAFESDKQYNIGDSLELSIPGFNVLRVIPLEVGARCIVVKGKNAGERGIIKTITAGTSNRKAIVSISSDSGNEFNTLKDYVFVLGDFKIMSGDVSG
ncbi:MAG: 30S ribosomal protein S4e [Candidatus Micrarchaeia archaeon]